MDKNAIKKFAVWARRELIEKVSQKALQYGIEPDKDINPYVESVNGTLFTDIEKKQRQALINKIEADGYTQVIEEVAYTWFNRFIAIRFMEVNGYLPSHIRVFTDENNNFKPQIMSEALHLEFENLNKELVMEMKQANKDDNLFKYLLIAQCNELNKVLPGMFQHIDDYSELLLPDYLLREGSVIEQMVREIGEEEWKDQVQIIGWLYQYYNSEKKDDVFSSLKKKKKLSKDDVPAATQLFTPDWIVRYMVDNSLGKIWLDCKKDDTAINFGEYYISGAKNTGSERNIVPENLKILDPSMGSGHVLVYAFEALMKIYEAEGYTQKDSAKLIINNNLYGLDIDDRAGQLAYFAIMMMGRKYNRRIFDANVVPNVMAVRSSNDISKEVIDYVAAGDMTIKEQISIIVEIFRNAKEYGSILRLPEVEISKIEEALNNCLNKNAQVSIYNEEVENKLLPLVMQYKIMSKHYEVVVTNPPYAATSGLGDILAGYIKENYQDSKVDLFAVFMERCLEYSSKDGYMAMVTPQSWMFLSGFNELRRKILSSHTITSMVHLGNGAFDCGFGTTAFVIQKKHIEGFAANYIDVTSGKDEDEKKSLFGDKKYVTTSENMLELPNSVIAYWCSNSFRKIYTDNPTIKEVFSLECGIKNGNNSLFLRPWFSVSLDKVNSSVDRAECFDALESGKKKWFKCNKGGGYKKWYGNYEYVLDLEKDAANIRRIVPASTYRLRKKDNYFWPTLTWPLVSGNRFSARYMNIDTLPDVNANIIIIHGKKEYCLMGFLNSVVFDRIINMLNPTLAFPIDTVGNSPYLEVLDDEVERLVRRNIELAKEEWDESELSWDFCTNPLVGEKGLLQDIYAKREHEVENRYNELKNNEERINEIYIERFGLEEELSPIVDDNDITIEKTNKKKEVVNLISYAVGCMFGRYSLEKEGIVFAGGLWKDDLYGTYIPDEDNIIPICDDAYFEDDIVGRFLMFIAQVFGEEYLEQNIQFIADALEGKGSARDIIRNYFLNDFYKDHCNKFSVTGAGKQPIYWLFDSGKKSGFKCLCYIHRYKADLLARIRTDYVHEQQSRYHTAIEDIEKRRNNASDSSKVKLNKKLKVLKEQSEEVHSFEEKLHHLADKMIQIDLDDDFKTNYANFEDILSKIR